LYFVYSFKKPYFTLEGKDNKFKMTGNSGRGRRSRRHVSAKKNFVTMAHLKRENHLIECGQRFNPSIHPPDFMANPWNNLTVRIENFTSIAHTAVDTFATASLGARIRSQLNLPDATILEFRIQNIRIWGPIVAMNSASALPNLRAQFWSLIPLAGTTSGTSYAILEDISAYPDQVSRASLGFTYPKAQQSVALQDATNGPIVSLTSGSGAGNIAYIKVVWRPRPAFSALEEHFSNLLEQTSDDDCGFVTSVE